MKKLWILTLTMLTIFVLAACGGDNNEESSNSNTDSSIETDKDTEANSDSDEEITLNFWAFGATNYEEMAAEYEKDNPNVKIKFKTSETDEHHDALFNALSAGSGAPDIVLLEVDQLDRFKSAQDRFVNLYDVGAKDIEGNYLDWKWQAGENLDGDFLIGLPTDIGPKALYYRTDVFEEAGLPTEPEEVEALIDSPEAFIEAGKQVKEKTGKPFVDSIEMAYRAYLDAGEEGYLNPDGELIVEEDGSAVKKADELAVELHEAELVGNFTLWSPEWANAVNEGGFAAELGAGWLKGWLEENAPDASGKFRVATLPTEFSANWGGSYLAIPAETDHSQAAYDFISWLTSAEGQLKSFQSHGLFPSAPEVYEQDEFKNNSDEFFGGQVSSVVFAEAAQDVSGTIYKGEKYVAVHNEFNNALINVQDGADPEEEWEAAVERAKGLVSR